MSTYRLNFCLHLQRTSVTSDVQSLAYSVFVGYLGVLEAFFPQNRLAEVERVGFARI